MIAALSQWTDVSALRGFLRPSRGLKRTLDDDASGAPSSAKRPRSPMDADDAATAAAAHLAAPPPLPAAPVASFGGLLGRVSATQQFTAARAFPRAPQTRTPNVLDVIRMRSDRDRFLAYTSLQPAQPPLTAGRCGYAGERGALVAPPTVDPARRLDTAFDGAAGRAQPRLAVPASAFTPRASELALAPTSLPSPTARPLGGLGTSLWSQGYGSRAAAPTAAGAPRFGAPPLPAAPPAAPPAKSAWQPLGAQALSMRELVEHQFQLTTEPRCAELNGSLVRLTRERAAAEAAKSDGVLARVTLTLGVTAALAALRASGELVAMEAEQHALAELARAVADAADGAVATAAALRADLRAVPRAPAAAAAPAEPVAAARARCEALEALSDALAELQAACARADDAHEAAAERRALLRARLAAASWADDDRDSRQIGAQKDGDAARRVGALQQGLAALGAVLARARDALRPPTDAAPAALAAECERALAAARVALAAARAAAPVRRPCGVRVLQLRALSAADEALVATMLAPPHSEQPAVSTYDGQRVSKSDLATLRHGVWLNDEVINLYLKLLLKRASRDASGAAHAPRRAHVFQTFFFTKLTASGGVDHDAVKRWTKKIDLFKLDAVVVPINVNQAHWVLALVNMLEKRFEFFDSLGGRGLQALASLRRYVQEEHRAKFDGAELDLSGWTDVSWSPAEIPQQNNGFDCGVFMCQFASAFVRNVAINFDSSDMPYMRRRMVVECMAQELWDDDADE